MRTHKMTEWDAGQDMIACADYLAEKAQNLREGGFTEQEKILRDAAFAIGRVFNRLHSGKSHVFGLADGGGTIGPRRAREKGGKRG